MKVKAFHDKFWWPDNKARLRECTLLGYQATWKKDILPVFGNKELNDIKVGDIEEWMRSDRFKSAGGANNAWRTLRIILREAYRYDFIDRDITKQVRGLPRTPPKKQPVLTKDEIKELLDGLKGSEIEMFVLVSVSLGLRKEEGCALEWNDINLQTGEVKITKGAQWVDGKEVINPPKTSNSYRTIFLPDFALARVREIHREMLEKGELHPRITGELTPNKVTSVYQKEVRERGLPYVPPKNLRHTWATVALREGVPISTVSKQLGHYDVSVTADHYIVPNESDFKEAQKVFNAAIADKEVVEFRQPETFMERLKFLLYGTF